MGREGERMWNELSSAPYSYFPINLDEVITITIIIGGCSYPSALLSSDWTFTSGVLHGFPSGDTILPKLIGGQWGSRTVPGKSCTR